MANSTYEYFSEVIKGYILPAAVIYVKRDEAGAFKDAGFLVVNESFKKGYITSFRDDLDPENFDSDEVAAILEGKSYSTFTPRDVKFENMMFEASFGQKHIHTYVDTTSIYDYWTEDMFYPIACPYDYGDKDPDTSYCLFMYTLNKDMDTGKYASVSPDISSFVIKTCLELRSERTFLSSMATVVEDIKEYTGAYRVAVITYIDDERRFNVVAESSIDGAPTAKELFSDVPFEIIQSWERIIKDTNYIIIKDENDFEFYEEKAPEWIKTLRENDFESLCMVPLIHKGAIIGFLYIKNFDTNELTRIKETMDLVGFFIASEVANNLFLERMEYLSNVDMLTGVYNRNCMNVNVDELSLKLSFEPHPFSIAFCDLNGLKSINDNGGHDQGDKLIVYAADLLKEIFEGDKIYRAGGDEFVVMSYDSRKSFGEKIERLRERASDPDWLYFSIGSYHDETGSNLRLAMRYADEEMYRDKEKYYATYPDKKR